MLRKLRTYMNRKDFLKGAAAFVGLSALEVACATTQPDFYLTKGQPNTMTYMKNGREVVVYNLNGRWEAQYPGGEEIVEIEQKGNKFDGYKTVGNTSIAGADLTISGTVDGNLVNCLTYWSGGKKTHAQTKISPDGNSFICVGSSVREFKRVK